MDAFYRLATLDYKLLAEQLDWPKLFRTVASRFGLPIRLLDVACGSGKFPQSLLQNTDIATDDQIQVEYSLLDPSPFSVSEAKSNLRPPFFPGTEYTCKVQDLDCRTGEKAVVWATHALYCVPLEELSAAITRMIEVLDTDGIGFIAHASGAAHYIRFHDIYLRAIRNGIGTPFTRSEHIKDIFLNDFPDVYFASWPIYYEGVVNDHDWTTVERYLQRCLFDNNISLDEMLSHSELGTYLRTCHDGQRGVWRFPQTVELIFFGGLTGQLDNLKK